MLAYPLQTKESLSILSLIFLCLFFSIACKTSPASGENSQSFFKYNKTPANFDLGDTEKYGFSIIDWASDGAGKLLVQYEKKILTDEKSVGKFIRLSKDAGSSFGEEFEVANLSKSEPKFARHKFVFSENEISFLASENGNLFFSQSAEDLKQWSEPVRVNDEQGSLTGSAQLLLSNANEAFCVWVDKRRGYDLIFFSKSQDGGKTWSPNQPVEYEFREGNQQSPQLIAGADDRLLLVWQDWRDRKTLSDIRASYSDDKGKTWSASRKINDDELAVWQVAPTVVSKGSNIYVAFEDFREEGEEDDNDWNIYFARSNDNGSTWEKNKRLNDVVEGRDSNPSLSIDKNGNVYCIWLTARETLFGQVAFSYSQDKGKTWSPSVILTPNDQLTGEDSVSSQIIDDGKLLTRRVIIDGDEQKPKDVYSFVEKSRESIAAVQNPKKQTNIEPMKFKLGETLFTDDFSGSAAEKWEAEEGLWKLIDGTYMGSKPGSFRERFVSYAKFPEPERYVMSGQFKLDSMAHMTASLYFRVNENRLRYYYVKNQFRRGAWLSVKDNDLPESGSTLGGKPVAQKRFSFRQDRWYKFKLVVTPERVDYYVDGQLTLSYDQKLTLSKGSIGIGGQSKAPTYFDDIAISELKE